jgi:hypothetical protein
MEKRGRRALVMRGMFVLKCKGDLGFMCDRRFCGWLGGDGQDC